MEMSGGKVEKSLIESWDIKKKLKHFFLNFIFIKKNCNKKWVHLNNNDDKKGGFYGIDFYNSAESPYDES
jgi:hypothetical protein